MKKLLLAVVALFIMFWIGTIVLIPSPLTVSSVGYVKALPAKVSSLILDTANWPKWWLNQSVEKYSYSILSKTAFSAQLLAKNSNDTFSSELLVLPATQDSAIVQWKTIQPASINPFVRIGQYKRAANIKQHFQVLLNNLTAYATNRKRMYGMDIAIINFTNPFMLSTQAKFTHYPSVNEVYQTIEKMRKYAQAGGAAAVDSPMVNIEWIENSYLLRTALPINKKLTATTTIDFKQMVLGKTLLGTVSGGKQTVEKSLQQMLEFIGDYRLSSPAIPFQLWTTNRQQQPDSSKWITKLYYPIF